MDPAVKQYFHKDLEDLKGSTPDEHMKKLYDNLAETYEKVNFDGGYRAHAVCTEIFYKTLEKLHGESKKNLKILDAGAGTGIIGSHLKDLGYTHVDAVDISPKMLNLAREKNVYKKVICAALCADPIAEIPTGTYDATVCVAAITTGHIKPAALDEMVRHIKPGGIICFTIRRNVYETEADFGYQTKMQQLEQEGKWELVSKELIDYYTNVDEIRLKCYAFVYKVTSH